jgi:broad specificity phosphatase PhoE
MASELFSLAHGATEVLLVRHADATPQTAAESEPSERAVYRDLPLTDEGRRQAQALGKRLAGAAVTTIYSSPVRRAIETAQAISRAIGRAIAYDDRLREAEIGGLDQPRHPAEFGAHLERLAELAITHRGWSQIRGSEASDSIRTRMRDAIDAIAANHPGKRIVAVTHAGTINAYLADVLGLDADFFFPAANTSINTVRLHRGQRLLMALNDVAHLHAAKIWL